MNEFYDNIEELQVGIDEAGRGCLFGPVCVAAVIMNDINDNPPPYEIKDSKKCSSKKRKELRKYIEKNAISYNVQFISETIIDKHDEEKYLTLNSGIWKTDWHNYIKTKMILLFP